MSYKALYRTYRPQTFEEVAGQQHIVKTLKNALASGKIAHAYLFAGPRGTGKTTMAKLLAKALNCEEGIGKQCNECKNCKAIMDGTHPDVLEIDAASNNGVDEVRDLIDKVKYGTILGKYKVYIIDEVHSMSQNAFNALLKTLEEPPEHVIFILATTEPHKILPTILSRCQRYDFSKVSETDIKNRMVEILLKEKIDFSEDALNTIISLADGGMRDALSILDQVIAYSGNQLNEKDVLDIFALESKEEKISLLNSISTSNIGDVLKRLSNYVSRGTDIVRLTNDLLTILKDLLIFQTSRKVEYFEVLDEQTILELNNKIKLDITPKMIDILMSALKDYKQVSSLIPLFEITLLKMSALFQNVSNQKVIENTDSKLDGLISNTLVNSSFASGNTSKQEVAVNKPAEEERELNQSKIEKPVLPPDNAFKDKDIIELEEAGGINVYQLSDETIINMMVTSKKEIKNSLIDNWNNLRRYAAHPILGKMANLLLDGHPLVAGERTIILEYPLNKTVEIFNAKENQRNIQNIIDTIFNKKMFAFAVSRNDSIALQKKYMDLLQINKLPKAKDVILRFKGEK